MSDPQETFILDESPPPKPSEDPNRPWWIPPDTLPYSPEPAGHLTRNMAYEVAVMLLTSGATLLMLCMLLGGQLQDLYQRLQGPAPLSNQVSLVTIGPEALYLWNPDQAQPEVTPRPLLSVLVQFLDKAGADVIVLDYVLDRPRPNDDALSFAAETHGRVISAEVFSHSPGSNRRFMPGTSASLSPHLQGAFANLIEEESLPFASDRLVRRAHLVQRVSRTRTSGPWPRNLVGALDQEGAIVPSLALAAAWLHQRPGDSLSTLEETLRTRCPDAPSPCGLNTDALGLPPSPTDLTAPLEINYRGPEGLDAFPTVSAARILRSVGQSALMESLGVPSDITVPDDLKAVLDGRVVVVLGLNASDRFVTPYGFPTYRGADMAGGRVQAHLIDTLLSGAHLRRLPTSLAWLLGFGLGVAALQTRSRLSDSAHATLFISLAVGTVAGSALLFTLSDGLLFAAEIPAAICLISVFGIHLRGWALEDALDSTELDTYFGARR